MTFSGDDMERSPYSTELEHTGGVNMAVEAGMLFKMRCKCCNKCCDRLKNVRNSTNFSARFPEPRFLGASGWHFTEMPALILVVGKRCAVRQDLKRFGHLIRDMVRPLGSGSKPRRT